MKEILINTFKKVFMSRKGLTWLLNWICDIGLTLYLVFYAIFGNPETIQTIFYIIIVCKGMQLITLGLIAFEKVKVSINK